MAHQLKLVLLMLLFYTSVRSQQISQQTINATGKSSNNGGVVLEDAVGGFLVTTFNTSTFMYTQDFLQPDAGTATGPIYINDAVLGNRYGIDNAGSTFTAGNAMIEFTVGEVASLTLNSTGNMLTQGILQPLFAGGPLPVTGMEFYAKRISSSQVQLDWKTIQEINNKGFHIERRKENENSFAELNFVSSKANGGNSSLSLQYQKTDLNNFNGNTYYRLKQEDMDGKATYSVVRIVKGDMNKQLSMQVWPVPAVGFFNVSVNGLDKPDLLQVLDMNGRLVKQFTVQNQTQQQVSGLPAGTYFVKLGSDNTVGQKVVIQ